MSGDIKVLDKNTANQIAAGEVVEKPASVVKELVENSLDAGATNISVTIFAGGTEFIRVTDNGSGMSETNAKLSVLRHATSKITSANDLLSLHTLGFRGEALPSIASVSKFNMLTRLPQEEFATSITMDGDSIPDVGRTGGNIGTTITVRDLFFNVPARRKFLRTVNTEGRYINEIIAKVALSRPEVHFSLTNNDKEIVNTPGNSDLKDTIAALYGKNVSQELLAVDYADNGIKITGFIGKPTVLKGTRQWQSIFVNGRIINNRMISKAIDHAYQSQIPKSGFPFAVIKLEMDSNTIDINVHPQKSEIKFGDEGAVYRVVYHALTDALTKPLGGQEIPGSWKEQ
jgi:DNA mismatch repair protein MutL